METFPVKHFLKYLSKYLQWVFEENYFEKPMNLLL
jgi:hypothetical protein